MYDLELFNEIRANADEYGFYTIDRGDYMQEYWCEENVYNDGFIIYERHWCKQQGCFATEPEEVGFVPFYLIMQG